MLNGGVSLAVWIGGVTREIDAARREFADPDDDHDTWDLYRQINEALDQHAVVDVIGGASAGGINGVLLGAAIFNCRPLADLRETWIELGDFHALLRPAAERDPPSLMKGDDVVLAQLRRLISGAFRSSQRWDRHLYVYVTATDLFGYPEDFEDSTGRRFRERDHRRVFGFQHEPGRAEPARANDALRSTVLLADPDAPELLARAARSSSSFPVAFEAHLAEVEDADGKTREHWLVDGGILDNQPFNPVLDRIAVLPADCPVRRVVMYVVPYVTELDESSAPLPEKATARDTYAAAGTLPRDLPKLLGLERVTAESARQEWAERTRARVTSLLEPQPMAALAESLFGSYCATRRDAAAATFRMWAAKRFRSGSGAIGQDPAEDPVTVRAAVPPREVVSPTEPLPWIPGARDWPREDVWGWGLSPAERAASWALLFLGDAAGSRPDGSELDDARRRASALVWRAREAKEVLVKTFRGLAARCSHPEACAVELARRAYESEDVVRARAELERRFRELDEAIAAGNAGYEPGEAGCAPRVQDLLDLEVVQNAFSIDELTVPSPFTFLFASAGIPNSLGHDAESPAAKLAGVKLSHFAGFLKRSWRANDWLWGRLDGVEHVLRAILDRDRIRTLGDEAIEALSAIAFGEGEETPVLEAAWRRTLARNRLPQPLGTARESFEQVLAGAVYEPGEEADRRFEACRSALAARIQLRIVDKELVRVAETARDDLRTGSSQIASGAYWSGRVFSAEPLTLGRKVELFRDMRIGAEKVADEASSRLVFDVGSQGVAVAAAMFAGDRGGLPGAARAALASARGLTLASSRLIQLLARTPAIGAAAFFVLVGVLVWAATAHSTLVAAAVPALAILAVVLGAAVLTLATSVFEASMTKVRLLAFSVVLGVPLAFALVFRWPGWEGAATDWLDERAGHGAVTAAAALALAAAAIAAFRLAYGAVWWAAEKLRGETYSRRWRRVVIGLYRWPVVAGLVTLAVGFVVQRTLDSAGSRGWVTLADERRGTILVLVLLAVILLAALVEELVIPAGRELRRRRGRRAG